MEGVESIHNASEGIDRLYSGQQIHAARRDFLISVGPFKNLYRGEDRDLYMRLFKSRQWLVISHKRFIQRLPRAWHLNLKKVIWDLIDQMATDLVRDNYHVRNLYRNSFKRTERKIFERYARLLLIPIAYLYSFRRNEVFELDSLSENSKFVNYRRNNTKTLKEHLNSLGVEVAIDEKSIFCVD